MIPNTYPSQLSAFADTREMIVFYLSSVTGLTKWVDYIPVKTINSQPNLEWRTDNDGYVAVGSISSITGLIPWKDYVPLFVDDSATKPYSTDSNGYIPVSISLVSVIAVLRRFGTNAHVYLPGVGMINGLQAANFIDSAGTTAGVVDQPVGLVQNTLGGIHASQTTAGNRPVLRRGAVNLLTYSQDFTNAVWSKTQVSVTAGFADPLGGNSASRILDTVQAGDHRIQTQHTAVAGSAYTYATLIKPAGLSSVDFYQNTLASTSYFSLNLTTGVVSSNGMGVVPSVLSLGNGWLLVVYTLAAATVGSKVASYISMGSAAGAGANGIDLYRCAVFDGTLTAAQILALGGVPLTTTAAASTALGSYWWDIAGGKSFAATFAAGNESVTVIDARPTGQVTALAQNVVGSYNAAVALGVELVADPGFNTPAYWSTNDAGWAVSGGVATATSLPDGKSLFRSGLAAVGKTYVCQFEIVSISSGGVYMSIGGTATSPFSTVGVKNAVLTASLNTNANLISGGLTNCVVDNFSVREVNPISGKIIVNGALTAPDLLLLQNFANKVAGL